MIALAKLGEPKHHDDDPRELGYPELIVCAGRFLAEVIATAGDDGYSIRADISRQEARHSPWPRWVLSREQAEGLFESLAAASRLMPERQSVYPILLWIVPRERTDLEELIETFRDAPFDERIFDELLSVGVVRFSLSDAFCDILGEAYVGNRVLGWLKAALETTKDQHVEWNVLPAL